MGWTSWFNRRGATAKRTESLPPKDDREPSILADYDISEARRVSVFAGDVTPSVRQVSDMVVLDFGNDVDVILTMDGFNWVDRVEELAKSFRGAADLWEEERG